MSQALFYEKPVLLNRETHRHSKIAPLSSYGFAAKTNSLYLATTEFAEACKEYPIVFTYSADKSVVPVAVLGLRPGENLFVDSAGAWTGRYTPAYARRYPFVMAELDGQKLGLCIDEAYPGLGLEQGEALFDGQGANTPFLQNALDFLNRYQIEGTRTTRFCQQLKAADLLTEMNAKADMTDGSSFTVNGLQVVDERKLLQMPEKDVMALFRAGELSWVYAHLLSLANMTRLIERLSARRRNESALSAPATVPAATPA